MKTLHLILLITLFMLTLNTPLNETGIVLSEGKVPEFTEHEWKYYWEYYQQNPGSFKGLGFAAAYNSFDAFKEAFLFVIKKVGWTTQGVKAQSFASWIQSLIGNIPQYHWFGKLQSLGAKGFAKGAQWFSQLKVLKSTGDKKQKTASEIPKPQYPAYQKTIKPQYPAYSKKNKVNQKDRISLVKFEQHFTPKNQTLMECAKGVLGQTAFASLLSSMAAAGFGSATFMGGAGFTTSGISAGSFAAWIHSIIGVAKAGSAFAYLQSAGAVGAGIFGSAFLAVTLGVGGTTAVIYVCNQCNCLP